MVRNTKTEIRRGVFCDVGMDANGNGKRDPLHGGPMYSYRRTASNDVSRTIAPEIIFEICIT